MIQYLDDLRVTPFIIVLAASSLLLLFQYYLLKQRKQNSRNLRPRENESTAQFNKTNKTIKERTFYFYFFAGNNTPKIYMVSLFPQLPGKSYFI